MRSYFFHSLLMIFSVGSAFAMVDANENGISDLYERTWNSGVLFDVSVTSSGDEDGDGLSNVLESIAGSDPFNGTSGFRGGIEYRAAVLMTPPEGREPVVVTPDTAVLTWSPLLPQKQYTVFFSPDLGVGSWIEIARFTADGSQTGQAVALTQEEGGVPPRGFFRIAVADVASVLNPGYTRHEMFTLGLDPDVFSSALPPGGVGSPDPNSDGSGPADSVDAAPDDATINWERVSKGMRYLWIPVVGNTGGFRAVDMSEKGHVLFTRILPLELPEYPTQPVGKVWDPSESGTGLSELKFHPQNSAIRIWSSESGGIIPEIPPWPMVSDDFNDHAIRVDLHSIGADGSVMADVVYTYDLDMGAATEHDQLKRTPESGEYVFLWQKGGYSSCTLLGAGRGYKGATDETWTSNQAVGFVAGLGNGNSLRVEALAFDQDRNRSGNPTTLELRSWETAGTGFPTVSSLETSFPNRTLLAPSLRGYQYGWFTAVPRVVIPYLDSQGRFRHRIDGRELSADTYFDAISELPANAAGSWGLGDGAGSFMIASGGGFIEAKSAAGVVRFDKQGIGMGNGEGIRYLWRNTEWMTFSEATGSAAEVFTGMKPKKITPGGLVWVSNEAGTSNGILVPFRVEDNRFASGLDDQSLLADPLDPGHQAKHWIMAPCGGAGYNNEVRFISPSDLPINLFTNVSNAAATPGSFNGFAGTKATVSWSGNGAVTSDEAAVVGFGNAAALDAAIGVKAMKKRTVRVKVFPVKHKADLPNVYVPPEKDLKQKLKEIFAYQLNAWPEIEIAPQTVYDYAGASTTGYEDGYRLYANTPKEHDMILAPQYQSGSHDIIVFLVDNVEYWGEGKPINGYSYPPPREGPVPATANRCIINVGTGQVDSNRSDIEIIRTVGHEMGHLMIGPGHPDEPVAAGRGPAPLEGTDRTKRLMCGGGNPHFANNLGSIGGAILMVKKEWDEAERWLVKFIDSKE